MCHALKEAPPPTLEDSRPPAKRPPTTPWTWTHTVPPLGEPQAPLPPTAVPTSKQLKAMLRAPPPPPTVTTALVPWDYTFVREQAPVTPLRVAPLSPPQARALQGAAPVVDQAWADIANDEEYILPATWYARPPTEAAPATPTEMPPLPPDTADAAPALIVYTEDSWPSERIAAPLGPLVPTERPLDDTNLPLPWTLPGALQGDEELQRVVNLRKKSKGTTPTFVYPGAHGPYHRVIVTRSFVYFATNLARPKSGTFVHTARYRIL